jgi:protein phosphatase 1L
MNKNTYKIKWECNKDLKKCNLKYSDFSSTTYELILNFVKKDNWMNDSAPFNLSWNLDINNDSTNCSNTIHINKNTIDDLLKDKYIKNIYLLENYDEGNTVSQKKIEFLNNNIKSNKLFEKIINNNNNKLVIDLKYNSKDDRLYCNKFNSELQNMSGGTSNNVSYTIDDGNKSSFIKLENSDILKFPNNSKLYISKDGNIYSNHTKNSTELQNKNNKIDCTQFYKLCNVSLLSNNSFLVNNISLNCNSNYITFNNIKYPLNKKPLCIKEKKIVNNEIDDYDTIIKYNKDINKYFIQNINNNCLKKINNNQIKYNDNIVINNAKMKLLSYNYNTYSIKNGRNYMEDRYKSISGQNIKNNEVSIFAVYDGHGGAKASEYLKRNLHSTILKKYKNEDDVNTILTNSFKETDSEICRFSKQKKINDGSTCTLCLIENDTIYTANAGDSRAILCDKNNNVVELSHDHKPNNKDEKTRIYDSGGFVENIYGCHRVNGILAVSRSFGDLKLKKHVISTPDIIKHPINNGDKYIILGTDGLWDSFSNKDCIRVTTELLKKNFKNDKKKFIFNTCKELVENSVDKGSSDNISCTIVLLNDSFLQ